MILHNGNSRICIIVSKELSKSIVNDLCDHGVKRLFIETGRISLLNKAGSLSNFLARRSLAFFPVEIINLFINSDFEEDILGYIAGKYDFNTPGSGSIYSHKANILQTHSCYEINDRIELNVEQTVKFFRELKGINCIVQRGEGDKIAKISLNYGASVPATTHGEGRGVRDKLGLLRITIPPEKEIINLILSKHDVEPVMELYISEGKLQEPGRGIAYIYPIKQGIVNTKISRRHTQQAASIEQVVSAIDSIKGGMEWRKSRLERESTQKRVFLTNLMELNLLCEKGYGTQLTEVAMNSGAPGATVCKVRYYSQTDESQIMRSALDLCKMIVPASKVEDITASLVETGCFAGEAKALLYSNPVEKAFTYLAK